MFTQVSRYSPVASPVAPAKWCLAACVLVALALAPACSRKSGCPVNDPAGFETDKDGNLKKGSKGSSNLFPKHMRRRG